MKEMDELRVSSMEKILNDIKKEVQTVELKFPAYNSSHEGYALIAEELNELWDLVKARSHDYKAEYLEAKHIACTAIRYMQMCAKHDKELQ